MNDSTLTAMVDELYALSQGDLEHDSRSMSNGGECAHCDFLHILKIVKDRLEAQGDIKPQRQHGGKSHEAVMTAETETRWSNHKKGKADRQAKREKK